MQTAKGVLMFKSTNYLQDMHRAFPDIVGGTNPVYCPKGEVHVDITVTNYLDGLKSCRDRGYGSDACITCKARGLLIPNLGSKPVDTKYMDKDGYLLSLIKGPEGKRYVRAKAVENYDYGF